MSEPAAKFEGQGWDRDQVSLRLTLRRKTRLLSLARELPPEATPTDAVDRALDLALAGLVARGREDEDDFGAADVSAALGRLDSGVAAASALLDAKLTRLSNQLAEARPLIEEAAEGARRLRRLADAAQAEDSGFAEDTSEAPLSIRNWLDRETRKLGRPATKLALVRAEWAAARKVSRALLSIDFSCRLVAVDNQSVDPSPSLVSLARLDLVDAGGALAGVGATRAIALLCEPRGSGAWLIRFHELDAQGKIGSMIESVQA